MLDAGSGAEGTAVCGRAWRRGTARRRRGRTESARPTRSSETPRFDALRKRTVKKQTLRRVSVVVLSDCDSWCNWARWYISIRVVEVSCRKRYGGGDLSHPRHTYNTRSERYAKTGDASTAWSSLGGKRNRAACWSRGHEREGSTYRRRQA